MSVLLPDTQWCWCVFYDAEAGLLQNTIDSSFSELAGCRQLSVEPCAVRLAVQGLDAGHTADYTTFKVASPESIIVRCCCII